MSCKGCRSKKVNLEDQKMIDADSRDFMKYVPISNRIMGRDRRWHSILKPLCTKKPIGKGWSVCILFDSRGVKVTGASPSSVVSQCARLFQQNNIEISTEVIWYNCNLQWISNSLTQDRYCSYEDLITLCEDYVEDTSFPPSLWIEKVFQFLGVYLAQERYDKDEFLVLVVAAKRMLDDERVGSEQYFKILNELLLEFYNLTTQENAREFMTTFINQVRKFEGRAEYPANYLKELYNWK